MTPVYRDIALVAGGQNSPEMVRALQHDLRALGYLSSGIDGDFGPRTESAVRALQFELLHNDGAGSDGRAGVVMTSINRNAQGERLVTAVTGIADQPLALCIATLLQAASCAKLPSSAQPAEENRLALSAIAASSNPVAPTPFVIAIVLQESGGQHYHVPGANDEDRFVTIGLDRNDPIHPYAITSRGFGIAQRTIYHHPPRLEELADFIADPVRNVQSAYSELRDKFNFYVAGPTSRADDRDAEHPLLPLRLCRYQPSDTRYMRDCKNCALQARKVNIVRGTPAYRGASIAYQPTQYYASANYSGVPVRADFLCDWPYAARRYNGSGPNSFHYQTRVLLNLIR